MELENGRAGDDYSVMAAALWKVWGFFPPFLREVCITGALV